MMPLVLDPPATGPSMPSGARRHVAPRGGPARANFAQTRNITAVHDALRGGLWRGGRDRADRVGEELSDLTVGVIGYGNVGFRIVRLLRVFATRDPVCDPCVQLSRADATDGMIEAPVLAAIKRSAVFVNTTRGRLLHPPNLTMTAHIAGASVRTVRVVAADAAEKSPPVAPQRAAAQSLPDWRHA